VTTPANGAPPDEESNAETTTEAEDDAPQSVRQAAGVAAWGVALWAAAHFAAMMIDTNPTASAGVQAVIAEFGAGRVGVRWNDPSGADQNASAIAKRAAIGLSLGLALAATALGVSLVSKNSILIPTSPSYATIAVGAIVAGFIAARDELLLHGVVLRILRGTSVGARMLACGLASGAAALAIPSTTLPEATASALAGPTTGALWIVDRGAWMAWGARVAWMLGTTTLVRGGVLDVRTTASAWAGADAGFAGGWQATGVIGAAAAVALYVAKRREGASPK
jgi:hypothetical protein